MADNEFLAAVPPTGGAAVNKSSLRAALVQRVIYPIADGEDPQAFTALDDDTGAVPEALGYNGIIFWLDSTDMTSAHDGITVVVTADAYRYKTNGLEFIPRAVLDKDLTDPPDDESPSPNYGDAYLVPAGALGDWAAQADNVAVWTARGWLYIEPRLGMLIYVDDEEKYYHYDADGVWTEGVGQSALADDTVRSRHVVGDRTHWVVVNQTTNTPPDSDSPSPETGVTYIIGGSPTGDWAGKSGQLAQWTGLAWDYIVPVEGFEAYDQTQEQAYIYTGAAWESRSGSFTTQTVTFTSTGTFSKASYPGLFGLVSEIWAPGGAGGAGQSGSAGAGGGGGSGAYSKKWVSEADLATDEAVTIAATTSFGAHHSATAGGNGTTGATDDFVAGGAPGTATGGDINIAGQAGGMGGDPSGATFSVSGAGGSAPRGGAGGAQRMGTTTAVNGVAGATPGGGGSGAIGSGTAGAAGAGRVILTLYIRA